jgi:anaerobic magnesium-protoporphyrin IX monomethyl ester cyclase
MKVTLVSTYTHPIALGLRYVSSYLKAAGYDVQMLFLSSKRDTARADFAPALLDDFVERCRDSDLIGMSLMTNTFNRACVLTERLRLAGVRAPIVWGGTHPTVAPEESLEVADVICVGEGEEPTLQLMEALAEGRDPTGISSLGFRAGGRFGNRTTVRNEVRALERDLDDYPFPDYELETHWVADGERLVAAHPSNLRGTLHRLRIETTRGCPYPCTFCNNAALLKVYRGKGSWVRKRSAENVIAEVNKARSVFPTIEAVNIVDDLFFVRSEQDIEDFAIKYKRHVNLPLEMDAFPNTISEAKVKSLKRVPIDLISMGIQSGSTDTLMNIYRRPTKIEQIVAGIDVFKKHRIRAEYHYIVSNPYEPEKNVLETMRFIADHHKGPAVLRVFPLMFYPGTPLYDQARRDGLIGDRDHAAYEYMYTGSLQFAKHDYLAVWLRLVLHVKNLGAPRWLCHRIIDFGVHPLTRRLIDRSWFGPLAYGVFQVARKVAKNLIYQPFIRPFKYLRRPPRYHEAFPEDEVTLPRNNMAAGGDAALGAPQAPAGFADRRRRRELLARSEPAGRWTVERVNRHAMRYRKPLDKDALHAVMESEAAQRATEHVQLTVVTAR